VRIGEETAAKTPHNGEQGSRRDAGQELERNTMRASPKTGTTGELRFVVESKHAIELRRPVHAGGTLDALPALVLHQLRVIQVERFAERVSRKGPQR
jgi:hypothetical protein